MSAVPRLLLVLGTRGPGLEDTLRGMRLRGDVVVAATDSTLAGRTDTEALRSTEVISAPGEDDLVQLLRGGVGARFDAAVTVADDTVLLTARICAALGLRGLDPNVARGLRDKGLQRQRLREGGLTVPRWTVCRAGDPPKGFPMPAILKPARGSGGTLIFVVTSEDELAMVLAECTGRVAAAVAVDDDTDFILEEIIPGMGTHPVPGLAPYVSVESVSVGGVHRHLVVTDRFPLLPPVLETGMSLPSCLLPADQAAVHAVVEQGLDALGFTDGLSHTEVMLTTQGPVLIEVNARMGGAIPYLWALAGGEDLFAVAADCALGLFPRPPRLTAQAACLTLQHPIGVTVGPVTGLDQVSRLPGVHAVIPLSAEGHTTTSLQDTLAALVLAQVPDAADAVRLHLACREHFSATYDASSRPDHYRRTPDGNLHDWP